MGHLNAPLVENRHDLLATAIDVSCYVYRIVIHAVYKHILLQYEISTVFRGLITLLVFGYRILNVFCQTTQLSKSANFILTTFYMVSNAFSI